AEARELLRIGNVDPAAVETAVHVRVHRDLDSGLFGGGRQPAHAFGTVDVDAQADAVRELRRVTPLRLAEERVRNDDVADPRVGEHVCLGELGAGDPDRPRRELALRDLRRLVRLDVRAEADAGLVRQRLPAL